MFNPFPNCQIAKACVVSVAVACVAVFPRSGFGQQVNDMIYHTDGDQIPSNICADVGPETGTDDIQMSRPSGNLHGDFYAVQSDLLGQRAKASPLFTITFQDSRHLYRDIGGNAFYSGDLIPWENSWLLCVKGHSQHFAWLDTSKPFLRILPVQASLTEDGYYRRVEVKHYWHSQNRKLSLPRSSDRIWIME
ncbi:hypothetical protein [Pseudaestuariivita rosea]|uniref:hypothetical protein n=1 Tax=Pseudaestuariivita rosea TaxID=2763263 RepID=UPI001ABABEB6|nr:hypothetical protein [Pseudaestuariivita rosea]